MGLTANVREKDFANDSAASDYNWEFAIKYKEHEWPQNWEAEFSYAEETEIECVFEKRVER